MTEENSRPTVPRRNPPPDVWTIKRRRTYPPTIIAVIVGVIGLAAVGLGWVISSLGPALLGGYNACPGVSNLQAFQQIEDYALIKFPPRFQLNGNRFSAEFDIRARNECDLFLRFDLEPSQLENVLASTLLKSRDNLSKTVRPDAFGRFKERTGWPVDAVAEYIAGEARGTLQSAERHQSMMIDMYDPTRYVVYLIVSVIPIS